MLTELEFKGQWFLPNDSDKKVAGTLYYIPNEDIRLELIGGFYENGNDPFYDFINAPSVVPVIHGITYLNERAVKVTLFNCYKYGKNNPSCGFSLTKYSCQLLLTGKWLDSIDEIVFNRIKVTFPCLNDWLPLPVIRHAIKFNETTKKAENYRWEMCKENVLEKHFCLDDITTLSFYGSAGFKNTEKGKGYLLTEDTECELTSTVKCSFSALFNKASLFKDFLSLATLSTVDYTSVTLYDDDDYTDYGNSTIIYNPVCFYSTRANIVSKLNLRYDYLFKFHDIEVQFPDIIKKWFTINRTLAPIRTHLIKSIAYKKEFTSLDFLIVIQAIEGYHRRFVDSNSKTYLSTRLKKLYEEFDNIELVKYNKVHIGKVTASRNYYSHFFAKEGEKDICDGIELWELTSKLKLLLICCTLKLIGFSNNEINKLLLSSNKIIKQYSK